MVGHATLAVLQGSTTFRHPSRTAGLRDLSSYSRRRPLLGEATGLDDGGEAKCHSTDTTHSHQRSLLGEATCLSEGSEAKRHSTGTTHGSSTHGPGGQFHATVSILYFKESLKKKYTWAHENGFAVRG